MVSGILNTVRFSPALPLLWNVPGTPPFAFRPLFSLLQAAEMDPTAMMPHHPQETISLLDNEVLWLSVAVVRAARERV